MIFVDRQEAGKKLATRLKKYQNQDVVAVALPRGGIPVGFEIARFLHVPLQVLLVRKIGSPANPEFAIGAIASGGVSFLDLKVIRHMGITKEQVDETTKKEKKELTLREEVYKDFYGLSLKNKTVILTDDGLATGATAKVAILVVKTHHPKKIILAVPGCPLEIVDKLKKLVDQFICLEKRKNFASVGSLYQNFNQISDEKVLELLKSTK